VKEIEVGVFSVFILVLGFIMLVFPDLIWTFWGLGFWNGGKTFENEMDEQSLGRYMRLVIQIIGIALLLFGFYLFCFCE
jgi:hypothetical protein